ncbi:hypothetical protein [Hufsiella ginkgonis]|uniref:Uncharacterized protein n=1 Tax=Hufsiella ginkgonis TaxID=2695274 RepID=A0A7K1XSG4_9SPHI|nr:hypothetical protein [Hufsiella ginkgonis]MXV13904.1 hypothetical protein [Hufsiella ginkgonis]
MKKAIKIWLTGIFMIMLQSCHSQSNDLDSVIAKYDHTDFSGLKNASVYRRSLGNQDNTSIYFVNIYRGKCSPYVVELNDDSKAIVEISNKLVLKSCGKDYLSRAEIEKILEKYVLYNLCLIQVDNEGNVYINPDRSDLPILLRKSSSSPPGDIGLFKAYKGNWYIRK